MRAWLLAAAIALALPGGFIWSDYHARAKALDFCSRAAPGAQMDIVRRAAGNEGLDYYRLIEDDHVLVAYVGLDIFSRHLCDVRGAEGRVVSSQYVLLD